jgi:hypothetical protein
MGGVGFVLLALCLATLPAAAETQRQPRGVPALREVVIVNRSARPIYQLLISASDADQWGDDRLGEATIAPGATYRVSLGRTGDCQFDIQVVYDDVSHEERRGVNLCRGHSFTFDGRAAVKPSDPFAIARTIVLGNRSARSIRQVFISPASADQWGDDVAPAGGIATDGSGQVSYRGGCTADLRVVFDNRAAEERRGLDLCATPSLLIVPGWTTAATVPVPVPVPAPVADAVTVFNRTGRAVTELYLLPESDRGSSAADLLSHAVLQADTQLTVPFPRGGQCRFVARVHYGGDRGASEQPGIDLCQKATITLDPPHGAG